MKTLQIMTPLYCENENLKLYAAYGELFIYLIGN